LVYKSGGHFTAPPDGGFYWGLSGLDAKEALAVQCFEGVVIYTVEMITVLQLACLQARDKTDSRMTGGIKPVLKDVGAVLPTVFVI
jgi:hypothetical protein